MVQPIRPQDAGQIYQRQVTQADAAATAAAAARRAGGTTASVDRKTDRVTISPQAQELARALQAVSTQDEVRIDRVAALRAQIEAGTYDIQPQVIAERLADLGFEA